MITEPTTASQSTQARIGPGRSVVEVRSLPIHSVRRRADPQRPEHPPRLRAVPSDSWVPEVVRTDRRRSGTAAACRETAVGRPGQRGQTGIETGVRFRDRLVDSNP